MTGSIRRGRARLVGHDVNTDYIISSSRKKETIDPQKLRHFLFETIDPGFAGSVLSDDIIVAGRNFGCGSAMEVAVTTVLGAGITCVVAESFARTYYRNAINNGLLPIVCSSSPALEGERLEIHVRSDMTLLRNLDSGTETQVAPLATAALSIVQEGGIVPYLRRHGRFLFAEN